MKLATFNTMKEDQSTSSISKFNESSSVGRANVSKYDMASIFSVVDRG